MKSEIIPIKNPKNEIILHDLYADGQWIGSRRTLDQAVAVVGVYATIRPAQLGVSRSK